MLGLTPAGDVSKPWKNGDTERRLFTASQRVRTPGKTALRTLVIQLPSSVPQSTSKISPSIPQRRQHIAVSLGGHLKISPRARMLLNREAWECPWKSKAMLLSIDNFSTTYLLCFFFFSFYNKIVVYYKTLGPKSAEKQLPGLALLLILYGTLALVVPSVQWRRWILYT